MQNKSLIEGDIFKIFIKYLFPSIGATLVSAIYVLGDSIIVGKGVGSNGIAALNIILPFFNLFYATGYLFGVGGAVYFSVLHGRGDYESDKKYYSFSLEAAIIISVIYDIVFQIFFKPIVYFIGCDASLYPLVSDYGRIFIAFAPVFVMSTYLQSFVRNDNSPVCAMIGVISGGITNIVFDYIFIYIFDLGMTGGVIATVMGSGLTCIILISHIFTKNNNMKLKKYRLSKTLCTNILRTGLPNFFIEFSNGIIISLFNIKVSQLLGDPGITAYSIISNSSLMIAAIANGISQGSQPIFAANYGANKPKRINKVLKYGLFCAVLCAVIFIGIFEAIPGTIVSIFVHSTAELDAIAIPAVRIYSISFLGMFINLFFSTYFQATGKSEYSITITALRGLVLSAALIFILSAIFGINGVWLVMPVTDTCVMILGIIFYLTQRKQMALKNNMIRS